MFNRGFAATVKRYLAGTRAMLGRPWRWLVVYLAILGATGWLFTKLPGSFLPDEDQGYFISVIQLPSGATRERTLEVLQEAEAYFLKQKEVQHVIGVAGFSFFGRGQNAAITFVRLKDWDERPGKDAEAPAVVRRANMAFFRIKQAMMFAVNVPPIPELAAIGGFDFRLQDRGGLGRDKLLEARNMALGIAGRTRCWSACAPKARRPGRRSSSTSTGSRRARWAWTSPTSTMCCSRRWAWPTSTTSCARAACCACRCRPSPTPGARPRTSCACR
jgi:multidrug efflux pump